jgi:hypothetical protein
MLLPPSLVWTRDALIEQCGEHTHVYGRWDRLFGSWRSLGKDQIPKAFTPMWPLLDKSGRLAIAKTDEPPVDEYGQWFLQESRYYETVELETCLTDSFRVDDTATADSAGACYLFQRYADLIPIETRRVASAFGSWQWVVLFMIRSKPAFQDFLRHELSVSGPGFVASCFALAGAEQLNETGRNELCERLMFGKRSALLARITGEHQQRATVKSVHKLDADSCSRERCAEVLALMRNPIKAQVVSHMPRLTYPVLWVLLRLPSWACSVKLVERLAQLVNDGKFRQADDVLTLCRSVEIRCPDRRRDVARTLRSARDGEHLLSLLGSLGSRLPFPPAPFPGDHRLHPLTSARMMRAEGYRMRNCIGELTWQVVFGSRYFYRWEGQEPATLCLERDASRAWVVEKSVGLYNQPLTPTTAAQIDAAVCAAQGRSATHDRIMVGS